MRVFNTKEFARFVRKERMPSEALCDAVGRAVRGLIDADLGGGVIKQRVARQGQGRSRGYRVIIAFRSSERSVFMYGFAKSSRANLSDDEFLVFQSLAEIFLSADIATMESLIDAGELFEVDCDDHEEG